MFLGQEVHYYMVCIVYNTELNLQLRALTTNLLRKYVPGKKFLTVFEFAKTSVNLYSNALSSVLCNCFQIF